MVAELTRDGEWEAKRNGRHKAEKLPDFLAEIGRETAIFVRPDKIL